MTTVSMADFALHVQDYLEQAAQGEKIRIRLHDEQCIALSVESIEKKYTKVDLLKQLSYQGLSDDSQQIDDLIY